MNEARPKRLTKDRLYTVGNTPSLRWLSGIRGREALVEIATYEVPQVTVQGVKRGRIEFPVEEITRLRAGVEHWRITRYRCEIRRRRGRTVVLDGTFRPGDHRALVRHLAEEMAGLGRFDRVQRGLGGWENFGHLVLWGPFFLLLLYMPFETWLRPSDVFGWQERLFAGGLNVASLLFTGFQLRTWFRRYRPRRARDMQDLAEILP